MARFPIAFLLCSAVSWRSAICQVVCTFPGGDFSGASAEYLESPAACTNGFPGGAVSVAFTATIRTFGFKLRIFDFFERRASNSNQYEHALMAVVKADNKVYCLYKSEAAAPTDYERFVSSQPILTNTEHRFLCLIDDAGQLELWMDGTLQNVNQQAAVMGGGPMEMRLSGDKAGIFNLDAMITDVWVWHEKVGWSDAEHLPTTTTSTTSTATTTTGTSTTVTTTSETSMTSTTSHSSTTTSTFSSSSSSSSTTSSSSRSSSSSSTATSSSTSTSTSVSSSTSSSSSSTASSTETSSTSSTSSSRSASTSSSSSSSSSSSTSHSSSSSSTVSSTTSRSSTATSTSSTSSSSSSSRTSTSSSSRTSSTSSSSTGSSTTTSSSSSSWSSTTTSLSSTSSSSSSTGSSTTTSSSSSSWSSTTTSLSSTSSSSSSNTASTTTSINTSSTSNTASTTTSISTSSTSMTETATTITTTTTGTTTTATYAIAEEGLLALVQEKSLSFLQQLASSRDAVLTDERPDGVIFAAELQRGGVRRLEIPLALLPREPVMSVWVPEEVFNILQRNDSKLAMLGAVPKDLRDFGGRSSLGSVQLEAVAVLDTFTFSNENLEIADLETPIEFTLPVDYRPGLVCGFWDESAGAWSTRGMALAAGNAAGSFVRCATRHLTLFGAFFMGLQEAIICSQFALLNADALAELAKSDWLASPGAVLFWCLLLVLLGICLLALLLDKWRGSAFCWRSEFFLVPLHAGPEECTVDDPSASEDEQEEEEVKHQGCMQVAAAFVGSLCMCKDSAFRDALDEIISEYFEQFSEFRTVIEAVWEGLEVGALRAGRLFYVSRSIMEKLVLSSSRRTVGASMGLSGSAVQFVLSDRHLRDLLMERHHRRVAQESLREGARRREEASYSMVAQRSLGTPGSSATVLGGSIMTRSSSTRTGLAEEDAQWWGLQKREDAWAALHDEICERMYNHVAGHHWTSVPRMTWATFVRNNPLGNIFTTNIFMGSEMQALFLILELVGDLLVVCLFFSASGRAKGKASQSEPEECSREDGAEEEIAYKMGRVLAVAMGSVVFAALPVNFLRSLHPRKFKKLPFEGCPEWQRQLRTWRLQDRLIWALGGAYLGCGLLYIALFLANISEEDHEDWTTTGLISLLQDTIVLPFIVALCMPMLAGFFLSAVGSAGHMDHQELVRSVQTSLHSQTNAMLPISCI